MGYGAAAPANVPPHVASLVSTIQHANQMLTASGYSVLPDGSVADGAARGGSSGASPPLPPLPDSSTTISDVLPQYPPQPMAPPGASPPLPPLPDSSTPISDVLPQYPPQPM